MFSLFRPVEAEVREFGARCCLWVRSAGLMSRLKFYKASPPSPVPFSLFFHKKCKKMLICLVLTTSHSTDRIRRTQDNATFASEHLRTAILTN